MKAMIFAAGLGTRLKPLTDTMPKALVPIAGKPMLEHVILKLKASGFTEIVINIHHFGEQIIDFLKANNNFGLTIHISDERDALLDTGGGIKKAAIFFKKTEVFQENSSVFSKNSSAFSEKTEEFFGKTEAFLVHNVDILSNVDLKQFYQRHSESDAIATLLVSERKTARYLLFDKDNRLQGWVNKDTKEVKPKGLPYEEGKYNEYAFSGIHVLSPEIFGYMNDKWTGKFSIIDFYLSICKDTIVKCYPANDLKLIDIGKPETLAKAEEFITLFQ